jgi:hypothetical protein
MERKIMNLCALEREWDHAEHILKRIHGRLEVSRHEDETVRQNALKSFAAALAALKQGRAIIKQDGGDDVKRSRT